MDTSKQGLTMKVRVYLPSDNQTSTKLNYMMDVYKNACNFVSQYYFEHGCKLSRKELHDRLYRQIRSDFQMKSQMSESVFITVLARYKTIKKQLEKKPYKYKDFDNKWHEVPRDLSWLTHAVVFRQPQVDLVYKRDWSFVTDSDYSQASINTFEKRVRVSVKIPDYFKQYLADGYKLGTAKLISRHGKYYLHVGMTTEYNELEMNQVKHTVGIDRGLLNLATIYDEQQYVQFIRGRQIIAKRQQYNRTRQRLQQKHTKSSLRRLRKIEHRENRWMTDINHQVTKALVDQYGSNTLFSLEDLTDVTFDLQQLSHKQRNKNKSWAFYQFEQFLTYKANLAGSIVVKNSAQYTSQRCPKCGKIDKTNRHHELHIYQCKNCGYTCNDDLIGAQNLQALGMMNLAGIKKAQFGPKKHKKKTSVDVR